MPDRHQRTKILYVITKSNFGGAQRYVFDLATTMPRDQFDVAVVAGGTGALLGKLESASVRTLSLPFLGRDISALADLRTIFALVRIFRNEKPHIIHTNSSKAGILGAVAGRLYRASLLFSRTEKPRIIFTAHGWAFDENRSAIAKLILKAIYWTTLLLSHKTIAVSEAVRSKVSLLPFVQKKITVIKNGIAPIDFLSREDARTFFQERAARPLPAEGMLVGTIAELHPIKGLRYAIEAVALLKDRGTRITYIIIGEGEERAALETLIKEKKLEGSVFLVGHINNAAQYLKTFDIFLLPSLSEGLPYVILEAGLAGIPVVATRVGGIPEIIEDEASGILVSPRSSTEISEALIRQMGHEKLQSVTPENFSLSRMSERTLTLYDHR